MRIRSLTQSQTLSALLRLGAPPRVVKEVEWRGVGESILVDASPRVQGVVEASGVRRKNLLLANFATLMYGILVDTNLSPAIDTGGSSYTLRTAGDVNNSAFSIAIGTGTSPPAMTDYVLTSSATLTTTRSISYLDTETQVVGTAIADRSFSEVGVQQVLWDIGAGSRTYLLTRSLMSGGSGTPIVYRIRFMAPWVSNFATIMYGVLTESNQTVTDIGGSAFTARSSAEVNAGAVYLVGSPQAVTWSPALTSLPSTYTLTSDRLYSNPRTMAMLMVWGFVAPTSPVQLGTVGLYQAIFDTAGVSRTVMVGAIPMPSPVELPANRVSFVFVRFLLI